MMKKPREDPWLLPVYIFAGLMGGFTIAFGVRWWGLILTCIAGLFYCWLRIWRRQ